MSRFVAAVLLLACGGVLADVRLDTTFGNDGTAALSLPAGYFAVSGPPALSVLPTHEAFVAVGEYGVGTPPPLGARRIAVRKLSPAGAPDTGFGSDGTTLVSPATPAASYAEAYDIEALPDGRLLILGAVSLGQSAVPTQPQGWSRGIVARLTANGTPDPTFNAGAPLVLPQTPVYRRFKMLRHGDGLLVFVLQYSSVAETVPAVFRVAANGTLDLGFGDAGAVAAPAGSAVIDAMPHDDGSFQVLFNTGFAEGSSYEWRRYAADGSAAPTPPPAITFPADYGFVSRIDPIADGRYLVTASKNGIGLLDRDGAVVSRYGASYSGDLVSVEPFGDEQFLVAADFRSGFLPRPDDGSRLRVFSRAGELDTAFAPGGTFRPHDGVHTERWSTAVDTPVRFLMARRAPSGVVVYRYDSVRGADRSTAIPALGPAALVLLAFGLALPALYSRRRAS